MVPYGVDTYYEIRLQTKYGPINCRYYKAERAKKAIVYASDAENNFVSPAKDLYPKLANQFLTTHVSGLHIGYRYPTEFSDCIADVNEGIHFLKDEGVRKIGLVGHAIGGTVAVRAAVDNEDIVKTVVTLSIRADGAEVVKNFMSMQSILLLHGVKDEEFPPSFSVRIYDMAHEPKHIVLYNRAGHMLNEEAGRVYKKVSTWISNYLQ